MSQSDFLIEVCGLSAGRDGYDWFAVSFEIASFSFRPLLLRARHGQPCLSPQLPCPSTNVRICGIEYPVGCGRYEMTCHIRNLPVWRYLPPLGLAPNTKGGNLLFRSLSGIFWVFFENARGLLPICFERVNLDIVGLVKLSNSQARL